MLFGMNISALLRSSKISPVFLAGPTVTSRFDFLKMGFYLSYEGCYWLQFSSGCMVRDGTTGRLVAFNSEATSSMEVAAF